MPNTQILYFLNCEHVMPGSINANLVNFLCPACDEQRYVLSIDEYEWHAKCQTCRWSRWCGKSNLWASNLANGHYLNQPDHYPLTAYEKNPLAVKTLLKKRQSGLLA